MIGIGMSGKVLIKVELIAAGQVGFAFIREKHEFLRRTVSRQTTQLFGGYFNLVAITDSNRFNLTIAEDFDCTFHCYSITKGEHLDSTEQVRSFQPNKLSQQGLSK